MSRVRLYIAFADGVFDYACASCTALCCRGSGFGGNLDREMGTLLRLYPELQRAAVGRSGPVVNFATPTGGCFFLDSDNLCRIEKTQGKALKPGVCRLFPFNAFSRVGKAFAVTPHFMCPLRLRVPRAPGEVQGTHAWIRAAVEDSGLLNPTREKLPARFGPSALTTVQLVRREECFRDACAEALGRSKFRDVVRAHSSNLEIWDLEERAARILALDTSGPASPDLVDDLLLALAPPLRLSLLSLRDDASLRVLLLLERSLRAFSRLSVNVLSVQGAYQMARSHLPALRLLALGNEPMGLPDAEVRVPPTHDPHLCFAYYQILKHAMAGRATLEVLEEALGPITDLADRTILLMDIGGRVDRARSHAAS